jgi:hypothetical protein
VLVDNIVRPGDGVHSLLHMAAKQVARCVGEQEDSCWRGRLPVELEIAIETLLHKWRRRHASAAGTYVLRSQA